MVVAPITDKNTRTRTQARIHQIHYKFIYLPCVLMVVAPRGLVAPELDCLPEPDDVGGDSDCAEKI